MRKLSGFFIVILFLIFNLSGRCQTSSGAPVWFTIDAPEGSAVTANGSITLRFGQVASTCAVIMSTGPCSEVPVGAPSPEAWTSPKTFSSESSGAVSILVAAGSFDNVDPIPGVYKTLQVQEQSAAQSIMVNGQSVIVPALSSPWFTLDALEGSTVTANGSITLRFGQVASTCSVIMSTGPCSGVPLGTPSPEVWTSPKTFSSPLGGTVSILVAAGSFDNVDPIPGVYKTVQVQEQSTAQNITVNGQPVTVPALSNATCQLLANPSSITFPNTTVGYTYAFPATIVSNCSTAITITSAQTSGPFSVSGFQVPFSLGAGQTQNYTAIFRPTGVGTAVGNVAFISTVTSSRTSISLAGNGVSAQSPVSHSVSLTWDSSGSQIWGYNVYRSTTSGGTYSRINTSTVGSNSYTDQVVASGVTYFYVVTAIGTNGAESSYSNQAPVTVPNP